MQLSADAIWLATATVDMRTGLDGLSLHLQQALGRSHCDGNVAAASRPVHFAVRTDSRKSHPHIPLVTERQYLYWNSHYCKYAYFHVYSINPQPK
jgi:hypothetical protein